MRAAANPVMPFDWRFTAVTLPGDRLVVRLTTGDDTVDATVLAGSAHGRVVYVGALHDVLLGRPVPAGGTVEHRVEVVRSAGGSAVCAGSDAVGADSVLRVGQATVTWREPDR
ncbi:acyl dehydratase [Saccharothrix ecbatanensis]|uniref:Acyl dehydratase n=1 Tax=Saccharothrix ecbatanensis TaxID=1105145 RepID=A0A7W9M0X0_9PSEU|nr:hypothetical protein [Saccharothrix ecbatanensis]MBB5803248.1 acyl dehydratase [Saccharothrix ecbatanensis]